MTTSHDDHMMITIMLPHAICISNVFTLSPSVRITILYTLCHAIGISLYTRPANISTVYITLLFQYHD